MTETEKRAADIESMVRMIVKEIDQAKRDRQAELEEACDGIKYAEEQMAQGNRQPYLWLFEHFKENARKAKETPIFKPTEADRLLMTAAHRLQGIDDAFVAEFRAGVAYLLDIYQTYRMAHEQATSAAQVFFKNAGCEMVDTDILTDITAGKTAAEIIDTFQNFFREELKTNDD